MKGTKKLAMISCMVALALTATSCGQKNVTTKTTQNNVDKGPFAKYDPPITLTAVRVLPSFVKFREGENVDNNIWSRTIEEKLGIKIKYLWTAPNWGSPYDQKVNVMFASSDLPDLMPLYTSLFIKAVNSGNLMDLKQAFDSTASPRLKEAASYQDSMALKAGTFEGKLLGIASPEALMPNESLIWIRDDWMKKLNLTAPKTFEDVIRIARAFAKNDPDGNGQNDTYGFGVHKKIFAGNSSLTYIFAAYGVYPNNIWVEKDGKLVQGSTVAEVKEPLKLLAQLYKEGVIDSEFSLKSSEEELKRDIVTGKIGMTFGSPSLPFTAIGDAHKKDGAEWKSYPIVAKEGSNKPIQLTKSSNVKNFIAANATCKYPEAIVKLVNFVLETNNGSPEWVKDGEFYKTKEGYISQLYSPIGFTNPNDHSNYSLLRQLFKTGDTSLLQKMNYEYRGYYEKAKAYMDNKPEGDWAMNKVFGPGGGNEVSTDFFDEGNHILVNKAWYNETPAWVASGATLTSKMEEFTIRSILQGNVDEEYDKYVKYFNEQGGGKATAEINELYQKEKSGN